MQQDSDRNGTVTVSGVRVAGMQTYAGSRPSGRTPRGILDRSPGSPVWS